ncbi:MAG: helix-turn-helix transcriptional regulator [Bacteroidetes bacterium]|nr:helix-turn-helix transcriptional regulator [Bacteroidota bacterium]
MKYKNLVTKNELRTVRHTLNLRQLDVVCKLGFSTTDRLSRWEKGTAMPSLINLFRLAAIYDVAPHHLYPKLFKEVYYEFHPVNESVPSKPLPNTPLEQQNTLAS